MSILGIILVYLVARAIWHLLGYLPQIVAILLVLYLIGSLAS